VLVYSATLLNAPYIQIAPALEATQSALAADLLHCNAVGAFTAGVRVPVQLPPVSCLLQTITEGTDAAVPTCTSS
jgi:hypothetical protein